MNVSKLQTRILSISKLNSFYDGNFLIRVFRKPEYAIRGHQQIIYLAGRHCTLLNVSQPENAIPGNQQFNLISHITKFPTLKTLILSISKTPSCMVELIYLSVSQPENAIPDNEQIETFAVHHRTYLNDFQI